ncbi:hypothetical protein Tco_0715287 [Tanacetum coccineum]
MLTLLIFATCELFTPDNYYILGECAILNFNHGSTILQNSMFHVSPENNEFEGEIIPCSDFHGIVLRVMTGDTKLRIEHLQTYALMENTSSGKFFQVRFLSQVIDKFKTVLGYNAASSTVASPVVGSFVIHLSIENLDVTTVVTPSNVKAVESNHESANAKSNGDAVEPKTIRMNSFRPPVIEDWNSDDESEVEIIPKDKTLSSSTEKIKLVNSARERNI